MLNIIDKWHVKCYHMFGGDKSEKPESEICQVGKRYFPDGTCKTCRCDKADDRHD